jgi:two-component system nitrogen regulation response regulator NtrX
MDGMQILQHLRRDYPEMPVVMISGHGNIDTAVSAIKMGAYDFIEKPFKADRLILQVQHALDAARLKRENQELKFLVNADHEITGKSSSISQVRQIIERVAPTGSRVLISGPSGSGKEIAARMLHSQSRRAVAPFVVINCGMVESEQLELELFGTEHSAGGSRKIGAFEQAHGGTLYLDEVGDMPIDVQSKVVRIL